MELDFSLLPSRTLKELMIVDTSNYGGERVDTINFEITPPGFNKVNVPFHKDRINKYDSEILGITCGKFSNLPDGVYLVKMSVPKSSVYVEKSFIKTEQLMCKYNKMLLSLHLDDDCYDKSRIKSVSEIRVLIQGSVAAANNCDTHLSRLLYNKAESLIDRIHKCNCN